MALSNEKTNIRKNHKERQNVSTVNSEGSLYWIYIKQSWTYNIHVKKYLPLYHLKPFSKDFLKVEFLCWGQAVYFGGAHKTDTNSISKVLVYTRTQCYKTNQNCL